MTADHLDALVILFILLSALIAYFRGLIKEIYTLLVLYSSAIAAYFLGHKLMPQFNKFLAVADDGFLEKGEPIFGILPPVVAVKIFYYGSIYLIVFIVISLCGYSLGNRMRDLNLGNTYRVYGAIFSALNRISGAIFGAARGGVLLFAIYLPLAIIGGRDQFPKWTENSASIAGFDNVLAWTNKTFDLEAKIQNQTDVVRSSLHEQVMKELAQKISQKAMDKYSQKIANGEDRNLALQELSTELLEELSKSGTGLDRSHNPEQLITDVRDPNLASQELLSELLDELIKSGLAVDKSLSNEAQTLHLTLAQHR